jgi:hypothetical protein
MDMDVGREGPMPKIANYLSRVRPPRVFDEAELGRLQVVYEQACETLKLDLDDPRREALAAIIFTVADLSDDHDDRLNRVVALFRPQRG